jgi:hypothetical protein
MKKVLPHQDSGMEKRTLGFSLSEAFSDGNRSSLGRVRRGGVPQKALRSGAGTVPLGLPRGEQSEDRERIFHAGKNARLSEGLSRAFAEFRSAEENAEGTA